MIERFNAQTLRLFIRVVHFGPALSVSLLMFSLGSELIKMDEKYKFAYFMTLEMYGGRTGINIMQIDGNKWRPFVGVDSKVLVSGAFWMD